LSLLARSAVIGAGATAVMDLTAEVVRRTTGTEPLDYRLLGRWIGHLPAGRVRHDNIRDVEPVAHERELGLVAHYCIGMGFAAALAVARPAWVRRPTLLPPMITGLATTAAPWFIMQPAFGMGIAAAKTPNPTVARLRSLRSHAAYGLGLYLSARGVGRIVRGQRATAPVRRCRRMR
jgi:Protein of unknown function (DUF2938)